MKVKIISLLLFFCLACHSSKKKNDQIGRVGIPTLMINMLTGEKVMASNLTGKLIFLFFSPGCDHCKRQSEAIQSNISSFKDYSVYFLAGRGTENEVQKFALEHKLQGYSNIHFGTVAVEDVIRILGQIQTPSLFVYSEKKQLIKQFDGETPIDDILEVL